MFSCEQWMQDSFYRGSKCLSTQVRLFSKTPHDTLLSNQVLRRSLTKGTKFTSQTPTFARATIDAAFKHMLADDQDREPLISFLQAFTGINIKSVFHQPTTLPILKTATDEKQTFLDLVCRDDQNRFFHVEVQVKEEDYWNPRALYYAAGVYSQQLKRGEPWGDLKPVIALNILDHDRETLPDGHYRRDFQLLDRDHLDSLFSGVNQQDPAQLPYLRIIQFELPRVKLSLVADPLLREWLKLLKESRSLATIPVGVQTPIRKAYERLNIATWGSQLKNKYTEDELKLDEYKNVLKRTQIKALEEVAKKLIENQKLNDQEISDASGLSLDEVKKLRTLRSNTPDVR